MVAIVIFISELALQNGVSFSDDLHGSVAFGGILHTVDGGKTWQTQATNTTQSMQARLLRNK